MSIWEPKIGINADEVWNAEMKYLKKLEELEHKKEKWAKGGHVKGTDDDFYSEITLRLETDFEKKVWEQLSEILVMLSEKNEAYGNAALDPVRIFSKAEKSAQLEVRMDDKLSRIKNTPADEDNEDAVKDLVGYLILFMITRGY